MEPKGSFFLYLFSTHAFFVSLSETHPVTLFPFCFNPFSL
ncbi:hypothetical protein P262_01760 [Cronobacter malonaticus]|uniref:Uncharacterized protein n=1 Tax=Cronobacter malonaticus TaxID=413503 RepID=V5TY52_9ENTR|nr:hypothetical protein P262_01760 [Cronobacter malonaticus]